MADAAQASQQAGFTVRVPQAMTPSRISVRMRSAFTFKVDVAKAQALLNEAGRSDLVLPTSIRRSGCFRDHSGQCERRLRDLSRSGRPG